MDRQCCWLTRITARPISSTGAWTSIRCVPVDRLGSPRYSGNRIAFCIAAIEAQIEQRSGMRNSANCQSMSPGCRAKTLGLVPLRHSNARHLPQHGPSTTRLRDSLRNWSCLTWEIIVCGEIRKLAGLIGDPDLQRDDAQTRGRHQFLYLLSAGLTGALRVRPWAFDAGPPFSTL